MAVTIKLCLMEGVGGQGEDEGRGTESGERVEGKGGSKQTGILRLEIRQCEACVSEMEARGKKAWGEAAGKGRLNFSSFPTLAIAAMHRRGNESTVF